MAQPFACRCNAKVCEPLLPSNASVRSPVPKSSATSSLRPTSSTTTLRAARPPRPLRSTHWGVEETHRLSLAPHCLQHARGMPSEPLDAATEEYLLWLLSDSNLPTGMLRRSSRWFYRVRGPRIVLCSRLSNARPQARCVAPTRRCPTYH